jgi:dTDP-4-amino-4,6-dideoxygalactose transaminase
MFFSFYPTKPVGSSDGGIIVSNDKSKIDFLKTLSFNGMTFSTNNWERRIILPGYKFYMNSIQAYIANENLSKLDDKKKRLGVIRDIYNKELGYNNSSDHLYRINISNRNEFMSNMSKNNIICGIHYESQHANPVYTQGKEFNCAKSTYESSTTVSIPFHENLSDNDIRHIIQSIKKHI